jgi:phosphomannomutase
MTRFPLHYRDGGWFGMIGDLLTFATIDRFALAMTDHLRRRTSPAAPRPRVIVSFDARFLAERLAERLAATLQAAGLRAELSLRPLPTAALSRAVIARRASAGLHVTGRGADPEWGGIVWRTELGAPPDRDRVAKFRLLLDGACRDTAPPANPSANGIAATTPAVDGATNGSAPSHAAPPAQPPPPLSAAHSPLAAGIGVPRADLLTPWLTAICARLDFALIRRTHAFSIAVDAMHGVARRHLEHLLADTPVAVFAVRPDHDATFGGAPPDPWHPGALTPLRKAIARHDCAWGVALSGDGTRALFLDRAGELISPSLILALLAEYVAGDRGLVGPAVRSWSTDAIVEAVLVRRHRRRTFEVAPGMVALSTALTRHQAIIAGDHDGHLLFGGHVADSDPFLAALLLVEQTARTGLPLEGAVADLQRRHWPVHTRHHEFPGDAPALRDRLVALIDLPPDHVGRREVHQSVATGGLRLTLRDGGWVMLRLEEDDTLACIDVGAQSAAAADDLLRDSVALLLGRPLAEARPHAR